MTIAAAEPPAIAIDLTSQAFKENPFPTLAQMRDAGPVIRVRFPLFGKVWMATTYEAVSDLLRDHRQFVQNPTSAGNSWMKTLLRWLPRTLKPLATNMLLRDPPDHRRLRSLVDQAFQRHSIEALRPRIEMLADEALDRLASEAARSGGTVDLLAHFARPFPLAVICEMLGLPPEDRQQFTRWASRFSTSSSLVGIFWGLFMGVRKMMQYVRSEFRRQSREPRDGLLAALIQAEEAGDRLSEDELVAMVFLLLAAGHETTLHQIALSVLALLDHPEQLAELTADWRLADSAVQELLRYISFAQVAKPRYAVADTDVPRPADSPRSNALCLSRLGECRPHRLRGTRAAGHPPECSAPPRLRGRHPRLPRRQAGPHRDRNRPGAPLHAIPQPSACRPPHGTSLLRPPRHPGNSGIAGAAQMTGRPESRMATAPGLSAN